MAKKDISQRPAASIYSHPSDDPGWVVQNRGIAKAGFDAAHLKAARAQAMARGRDKDWPTQEKARKSNDNAATKAGGPRKKAPTPELKPEWAKRHAPNRMQLKAKRLKEIAPVFSRLKERVRGEESDPQQKLKSEFDRERE